MEKYRINKEQFFVCDFKYNDINIQGISLYFEYIIVNKKNKEEIYLKKEEGDLFFKSPYLCYVDKNNGFRMELQNNNSTFKNEKVVILYQSSSRAILWLDDTHSISISFDKGVEIIKNNYNEFDNLDNKPTENSFYFLRKC